MLSYSTVLNYKTILSYLTVLSYNTILNSIPAFVAPPGTMAQRMRFILEAPGDPVIASNIWDNTVAPAEPRIPLCGQQDL